MPQRPMRTHTEAGERVIQQHPPCHPPSMDLSLPPTAGLAFYPHLQACRTGWKGVHILVSALHGPAGRWGRDSPSQGSRELEEEAAGAALLRDRAGAPASSDIFPGSPAAAGLGQVCISQLFSASVFMYLTRMKTWGARCSESSCENRA